MKLFTEILPSLTVIGNFFTSATLILFKENWLWCMPLACIDNSNLSQLDSLCKRQTNKADDIFITQKLRQYKYRTNRYLRHISSQSLCSFAPKKLRICASFEDTNQKMESLNVHASRIYTVGEYSNLRHSFRLRWIFVSV